MNVNSPEERRARLEMCKGATDLPAGFALEHLNGLEPIQKDEIIVAGHNVHSGKTTLRKIREEVSLVFKHFNLFFCIT